MTSPADASTQLRAGVELICFSRLARWDPRGPTLLAADSSVFERTVEYSKFGRVISWSVFGVGCEYFLKGACISRGLNLKPNNAKKVLRPPAEGEELAAWIQSALARHDSVLENPEALGTFRDIPLDKLLADRAATDQDLAKAALNLFFGTMRNRDLHAYFEGIRASQFHLVEKLFVPALNVVLGSLAEATLADLRQSVAGARDGTPSADQ